MDGRDGLEIAPLRGLGAGAAWPPALARLVGDLAARTARPLRFSEVVAENVDPRALPPG